jgi:hypothetical protein
MNTKKSLLIGAAIIGSYALLKNLNDKKKNAKEAEGSLGGTDDLLGQQGFDIDPNSVPEQPLNNTLGLDEGISNFYAISPDGKVYPATPEAKNKNDDRLSPSSIPSNEPIISSGSGSLIKDASIVGSSIGASFLLPTIGRSVNNIIDTKYLTKGVSDVQESKIQKWLKNPYGVSKTEKYSGDVAKIAINKEGKTVLKTVPKWAKGVKTVANFIPIADIPIGAGLDVYFSKYEQDNNKKIDWWSAIKANTAGELSQLGATGLAAGASSVIPVAGTVAGGIGGFIVGTGADIATTEAYYKKMGKSSLFDSTLKVTNNVPTTKAQSTNYITDAATKIPTTPVNQSNANHSGTKRNSSNKVTTSQATINTLKKVSNNTSNITGAFTKIPTATVNLSSPSKSSTTAKQNIFTNFYNKK